MPLLHSVQRQGSLWNENKLRTAHPGTPHAEVEDIWLRFGDLDPYEKAKEKAAGDEKKYSEYSGILDEHESICYPGWFKLPEAYPIIFDTMRMVQGVRLGRVLITRLAPGKKITPHVDGGSHAEYYERYHCILQNSPGSIFRAGNETICSKPGELWWFDNSQEHEVINNSADDRLSLIIDIQCIK